MSISTNTYQQISFLQFLNEGLGVDDIVNKWKSVVPYRQKYIDKDEVNKVAELIALPQINLPLLSLYTSALARGERLFLDNYDRIVYYKPISGGVLKFEDDKIKAMEKMLRKKDIGRQIVTDLEKDHLKKQGIDVSDMEKTENFGNMIGLVTLDPNKMAWYQASHQDNIIIHIGCAPHIYDMNDKMLLSSIVYHEVRHAYDAYFAGIKRGEYDYMELQRGDSIEMKKYYKSLAEARAYTDQIIYLIEVFKKKYDTNTESAVNSIKKYLFSSSKFANQMPPIAKELFSVFLEDIKKNPKLGGFKEDFNQPAIIRSVEDGEISVKIGNIFNKIFETFHFSHNHSGEK